MPFESHIGGLLVREGGYVFDAVDPGGETNMGISKRSYPNLDIKNLTRAQAEGIYRKDFWERLGLSRLPDLIAGKVFDLSVNVGGNEAVVLLQRSLRAVGYPVEEDGDLGIHTATQACAAGPVELRAAMRSEAAGYYRMIAEKYPEEEKFLLGWLNRAYGV